MTDKKVKMIVFRGKKKELLVQLNEWCKLAGETANNTVLNLIDKHLESEKNYGHIKRTKTNK